jgi:hypothetical protein
MHLALLLFSFCNWKGGAEHAAKLKVDHNSAAYADMSVLGFWL